MDWTLWLILVVVTGIAEALTGAFLAAPLAIGAAGAAAASALGGGLEVQLGVFAATAATSYGIVRPMVIHHLRTPKALPEYTEGLVGAEGICVEPITRDGGQVKVHGEIWSAYTYHLGGLSLGTRVVVDDVESAHLRVSIAPEQLAEPQTR